ncbi:MAG: helix-turn-helix transcriptional regulator [Methyloceanibacter sp.]|uniref:helix-turn-helix transcriptional regulator n=1 Tax=Methyloceanibacter sp. TaxID=1965321 RepID=UPI003D6D865E
MQDREAQFLDALYLGVRDRAEFDQALNVLCTLFEVPSAVLLDFDAARPEVSVQAAIGVYSGEALERYHRDFALIDPAPPAFIARPAGTAIPTRRLLPEEYRRPSAFLGEFFRPLGLEECLGGTLASTNGRFALVGLHRAPERKAFDDDDIAKLQALMPHLSRALQLRRAFLSLDRKAVALSEACERLAAGVIGLDDENRSLFVNAAAASMGRANDGLAIDRQGRPYVLDRAANHRLTQLAADVKAGGAGGVARIPRAGGKPSYLAFVAPFVLDDGLDNGSQARRGVLYVIHDPLSREPSAPQLIAALFSMPVAAANMVAALANGESLALYAEQTGISMNTVRFHLKTAYARTGTRRQAELLRLVTAALRDLADHRDDRR